MPLSHFYKLPRDVLHITGPDSIGFLQGLITNDVTQCSPGKPLYAALLTPQGKFLHDMFLTSIGNDILIDCEVDRGPDLLKRLNAHKLRAKVTLSDVTGTCNVWASLKADDKTEWAQDPRHSAFGYRAIFEKTRQPAGEIDTTNDAYDQLLISYGAPNGSKDLEVGSSTVQEGNIDFLNGVSWTKGCYLGQELTARMHYRALVKKRLFPVRSEGVSPERGSIISLNGTEIGTMRGHRGNMGLACFNIENAKIAAANKTPLTTASGTLFVMDSLLGTP